MKILDTTDISDTVGMPVKGGTLVFLQDAYKEALLALAKNLIGPNYSDAIGYILFGCINSATPLDYNISAGAIFYNGEVFLVDAVTFTAAGGEVAVASISTDFFTDNADPVEFTDGGPRNVHQIRKIAFASGASGSGEFDFADMLQTRIGIKTIIEPTLGASYTVKFNEDQLVFFISATVDAAIDFDFTNATTGCVVRLKWAWGSGRSLTIIPPGGSVAYEEGGDIGRAASHTNSMYFIYLGKNDDGDDEVGYSISQIV